MEDLPAFGHAYLSQVIEKLTFQSQLRIARTQPLQHRALARGARRRRMIWAKGRQLLLIPILAPHSP